MKKMILSAFILALSALSTTAGNGNPLTVKLKMKEVFRAGERVEFRYELRSPRKVTVGYEFYIDCPSAPVPYLQERTVGLKSGETFRGRFTIYDKLEESIEPQTGTIVFSIFSPVKKTYRKTFRLETPPPLPCRVKIGNWDGERTARRVVSAGGAVYLACLCPVKGVQVEALLGKAKGEAQRIGLPAKVKLKPGRYLLRIRAQKRGFKDFKKQYLFAVAAKAPPIKRLTPQ